MSYPSRPKWVRQNHRPDWNTVDARIRDIVYLGSLRKVVADLASGGSATVVCQPDDDIPASPEITIGFPVSATMVVAAKEPGATEQPLQSDTYVHEQMF
ncbi:TOBE domain-containing protein [Mesorhizobium sp. B2-4-6]|nr:TOBE domain-containing protein [Mesorhizobium sp. B2-4-6]